MRVLFFLPQSPEQAPASAALWQLAQNLAQSGCSVRGLWLENAGAAPVALGSLAPSAVRITCGPRGEIPFGAPALAAAHPGEVVFAQLSDEQVTCYRDVLRRRLDEVVSEFDPHVIHVGSLWLTAHLALETGVPYVVTCSGEELAAAAADRRYARFVIEAAENAGLVEAASPADVQALRKLVGDPLEETLLPLDRAEEPDQRATTMLSRYRELIRRRTGQTAE